VRKKDVLLAGVMFLKPSTNTFEKFIQRSKLPPPKIWGSPVDCTEMALINDVFKDISSEQKRFSIEKSKSNAIGRPTIKRDWMKHVPWIVHYLTKACRKPWTEFVSSSSVGHHVQPKLRKRCDIVPQLLWERTATLAGLARGNHPFADLPSAVAFENSDEIDVLESRSQNSRREAPRRHRPGARL